MNFGRYRIDKEIGRGAMGVVYLARDPNLDLMVALKVLRREMLGNEAFVRRFISEAKALGRLDHPNIVRVFNVDRDGDNVYIAMEFIEGDSLSVLMKRELFSANYIAEFGAGIADALDSAHRSGIVHRDVKPGNILFKPDGRFKITDFGIAHIEDSSAPEQTQAGEILGTPAYMSPEQVLSRPVDGRSDLFSLGIILYEMATGVRPFGGEGIVGVFTAITQEDPTDVRIKNPEVPKDLSDAIMRCLRKKPEERYVNGRDLAQTLRKAMKTAAAGIPTVSCRKSLAARRIAWTATAGLVIALSGIVTYRIFSRAPEARPALETVKSAMLQLESTPAGARVFVDGTLRGLAPLSLNLAVGKHEVRLSLAGYYEWEAQVEMSEKTSPPLSVKLIPFE